MFLIASDRNITKIGLYKINIAQYLSIFQNLKRQYRPGHFQGLGSRSKDKTSRISFLSFQFISNLCISVLGFNLSYFK